MLANNNLAANGDEVDNAENETKSSFVRKLIIDLHSLRRAHSNWIDDKVRTDRPGLSQGFSCLCVPFCGSPSALQWFSLFMPWDMLKESGPQKAFVTWSHSNYMMHQR